VCRTNHGEANKRVVAVVRCGVGSGISSYSISTLPPTPGSDRRRPSAAPSPSLSPSPSPSLARYVFHTRANNSGNILTAASGHPRLPFLPPTVHIAVDSSSPNPPPVGRWKRGQRNQRAPPFARNIRVTPATRYILYSGAKR